MKKLVTGFIFTAVSGIALAGSMASDLVTLQAKQIAANTQIAYEGKRQKLDLYLHSLSSSELLSLIYSIKAEAILMHLANQNRYGADRIGLRKSETVVLRSPEDRYRLRQHIASFLLNSSSLKTSGIDK